MTIVLRVLLAAATLAAASPTSASLVAATPTPGSLVPKAAHRAFEIDEETAYILRVRRIFPEILRDVVRRRNIDLPRIARVRQRLRRDFEPSADREYLTIHVEHLVPRPKLERRIDPRSLADLRYALGRARRRQGGRIARARERAVAFLGTLIRDLTQAEVRTDFEREDIEDLLVESARFAIWSQDRSDAEDSFENFGAEDARVFTDGLVFKDRFGRLRAELGVSRRKSKDVDQVLRHARERIRGAVRFITEEEDQPDRSVTLVEVGPDLALLKGLFSEDCSSHECVGYPFAPGDRVFVALDARDEPRGGVVVSRVEYEGRPALYVNTLGGGRLDHADLVTMTLIGLRQLLGRGEKLLLPTPAVLERNFNYEKTKRALSAIIDRGRPRPIRFYDEDARREIERYSFLDYDAVERHTAAFEIPEDEFDRLRVRVEVQKGSPYRNLSHRAPTEREFLDATLELVESQRLDFAREFWAHAGRSPEELNQLLAVLTNAAREPLASWSPRVTAILERLGYAPDQIIAVRARPERFALFRMVAPDVDASAEWPRFLTDNRAQASLPVVKRWFADLTPERRETLLHAHLRAIARFAAEPDPEEARKLWVNGDVLTRLIDGPTLRARAIDLHAAGHSWPVLVRAAQSLAALGDGDDGWPSAEAGTQMMVHALLQTRTATEFREMFQRTRGALSDEDTQRAFGAALAHYARLGPSSSALETFEEDFGVAGLVTRLMPWALAAPAPTATQFIERLEALDFAKIRAGRLVVEGAVHARGGEFRRTRPLPRDYGRLRRLALLRGSAFDRQWVEEAVHGVHTFGDVYALERPGSDEVLLDVVSMHLERLAAALRATPRELRGPPAHPIHVLARRHPALVSAPSVAGFFSALHDHPLPEGEGVRRQRYGRLVAEEIDHFVTLGPSVAQMRALMTIAGEFRGYARRFAPRIDGADTLARMVAPVKNLGAEDAMMLRYEFSALIAAVAARPAGQNFLDDATLDRVMSDAGLGGHRHEIRSPSEPTFAPTCERSLKDLKSETPASP